MNHDELDDLFRQELDDHASPPGPDLWARLQARTAAEATPAADASPLDTQFRAGLAGHATPPRRELWERLEDEHLRPRQRRRPVVAWGRLAVAASLLLFVLAGGAGLWLRGRESARGPVAITTNSRPAGQPELTTDAPATTSETAPQTGPRATEAGSLARAVASVGGVETDTREKNAKNLATQATASATPPSSSPVASTARTRHPATAPQTVPRLPATRPDAAGHQLASTKGLQPSGGQPAPAALAVATPAPTEAQVIEVDVRRGAAPAGPVAPVVAAAPAEDAATPAPERPHRRLGGLLRQAGHALRGESVSLAEATGLPESVTVQAHLGGRVLSKTIQL